jgi:hypothetical protein
MSLLSTLSPDAVVSEPFPHLVVKDALDPALCDRLTREFPAQEFFVKGRLLGENKKIVRRAVDALREPGLSPAWRSMIEEHLRPETFAEWVRLFGEHLWKEYPQFAGSWEDASQLRIGTRSSAHEWDHDVLLDAALVAHTPVRTGIRPERGPHVKEPDKPFLGFLFLRPEEDHAEGAELCLYRTPAGQSVTFTDRNQVATGDVQLIRRIPYRRNTLVLLLNTPHTVTTHAARGASPFPAQYFHFLAQVPVPLFKLPRKEKCLITPC